jgi:flagellar biosynthesis/type III secretory pathway protein FliH
MSNGIYLTLEQYKDKDLPLTITVNGNTYHSQFALATAQTTYFEKGYEIGKYEGYEAGKSESYGRGWIEGHNEASIKQFDEYSVKLEERYKSKYDAGFNDGYEQCKHDGISNKEDYDKGYKVGYEAGKVDNPSYMRVYASRIEEARKRGYEAGKSAGYDDGYNDGYKQAGISKINLNTEPVEQTELSKEYDKGFTKGYEEGFEEGKSEGYEIGKKANGISKKEIPGEYLAHIEEARKQGYADGYKDCREVANCREVAKMLNKYGIDEDGPCNDCKEEPGRDEDGPEQTEYAKGYEDGKASGYDEGYEDGRMDIMQFIGNNRG